LAEGAAADGAIKLDPRLEATNPMNKATVPPEMSLRVTSCLLVKPDVDDPGEDCGHGHGLLSHA
jgi:hypothetical protein